MDQFLALDLEYVPGGLIWLVGVCLVGPSGREHLALWANTPAEEKANLKRLAKIAAANSLLPVITWSGNSADMPHLRGAAERLDLGQALKKLESRHMDLFVHAAKALRLPIPGLGLDEVANYFGIERISRIQNGFEALSMFRECQVCSDEKRLAALKADLLEYNREDLEALVEVAQRILALQAKNVLTRSDLPLPQNRSIPVPMERVPSASKSKAAIRRPIA
jgi:predicted RecB family nuclease